MKKILLSLLFVATMTSCSVLPKYPYVQNAVVLDYSEYTNKGFFMTEANSVSFGYKALGSVSAKVQSGYEVIGETIRKAVKDDIYGNSEDKRKVKYGKYKRAYSDDALKVLYEKAKEIGANGLINIKISYVTNSYSTISDDVIIVTGMAIRK